MCSLNSTVGLQLFKKRLFRITKLIKNQLSVAIPFHFEISLNQHCFIGIKTTIMFCSATVKKSQFSTKIKIKELGHIQQGTFVNKLQNFKCSILVIRLHLKLQFSSSLYPLASEASRMVENLTERKYPHTPI